MDNIFLAVFIPITTGIVEVIKKAVGERINRFAPAISLIVGLVISIGVAPLSFTLTDKIIYGLIVGLSASGFYDGLTSFKSTNKSTKGDWQTTTTEDNSTRG